MWGFFSSPEGVVSFFFPLPELPVCQWLFSEYWHKYFTKERAGEKRFSQLFLTVAQYRSVVYCSITLCCCCFSSRISGRNNESGKKNCKTSMFYLWSKQKKKVSFDHLVVHIWIDIILKTVSCNIGV